MGFTTEEAIAYLREMRDEMSPGEFRRAMQRTLENLPPSQRDDFIQIMREYQTGSTKPAVGAAATGPSASASTAATSGVAGSPKVPGARGTTADPFGGG